MAPGDAQETPELTFYVGTYTNGRSEGIYVCSMDPGSGTVALKSVRNGVVNPSYLVVANSGRFLYSVNEISGHEGGGRGTVSSFRIDERSGGLEFLNSQPSHGSSPCHLTIDHRDAYVVVSNYGSGSVAVLPVMNDGSLGPAVELIQHSGSGLHRERQNAPHTHSAVLDDSNRFAVVADLGTDRLAVYRFCEETGDLQAAENPFLPALAGAGPRHIAFAPGGGFAYVTNELNSTLAALEFNATTGQLRELQVLSTLPQAFCGQNLSGDVSVHPSGAFVYASNRGHDSIAVFAVDEETGTLTLVQHRSSLGKTPRGIVLDPTGEFLLVANQETDSVVVFAVNPGTGMLSHTGHAVDIPAPTCVRFLPGVSSGISAQSSKL